jgi:glycosyltransferase involved in cell wall biosynthesis
VVSTTVGAEGLNAIDGQHMMLRDTPRAFADAVIDLLENPAKGAKMGHVGREWVAANHAWSHSAALLRQAYAELGVSA